MSASIVYYILSVIKLRYFSAENAILFFFKNKYSETLYFKINSNAE